MTAMTAMRDLTFSIPGVAVPQGSMKPVRMGPRLGVQPNNKQALYDYRARVAMAAQDIGVVPWEGPIELEATFFFQRPKAHFGTGRNASVLKESAPLYPTGKPDLDKVVRALLDGLTGACFKDDSQVVVVRAAKHYCPEGEGPQTVVSLWAM